MSDATETPARATSDDPSHREQIAGDLAGAHAFRAGVEIAGNVTSGKVAGGDVRVGGDVRGASVLARRSLDVGGGIVGGAGVRCFAASTLRCRDAADATLIAGDRLSVDRSLANSRACSGTAVIVGGAIVGGRVAGNGGIRCAIAGSPDRTPTFLASGIDLHFAAFFARHHPDVARDLELAARAKAQVAPLLAQLKTLSAAQKESVTISLYEADQLLHAAQQARAMLLASYTRSRAQAAAEIRVAQTLFAGVTLLLNTLRATTRETFEGPIELAASPSEEAPAILLKRPGVPDVILPATRVADPALPFDLFFADQAKASLAA